MVSTVARGLLETLCRELEVDTEGQRQRGKGGGWLLRQGHMNSEVAEDQG